MRTESIHTFKQKETAALYSAPPSDSNERLLCLYPPSLHTLGQRKEEVAREAKNKTVIRKKMNLIKLKNINWKTFSCLE